MMTCIAFLDSCFRKDKENAQIQFEMIGDESMRKDYAYRAFALALSREDRDMILWFVKNLGLNINWNGKYAILLGIVDRNLDFLNFLEDLGASLDTEDEHLWTAAVYTWDKDIINYMLKKGYDINMEDDVAIKIISRFEKYDLLEFFLSKGSSDKFLSEKDRRFLALRERVKVRAQNKIFFWVFPKIYRNPEFVAKQAKRSWDAIEWCDVQA